MSVCPCSCVYACVCICSHVCVCMHVHSYLCVYEHGNVYTYVSVVYVCTWVCVHSCLCMYAHRHVCAHVHTCMHVCACACRGQRLVLEFFLYRPPCFLSRYVFSMNLELTDWQDRLANFRDLHIFCTSSSEVAGTCCYVRLFAMGT